MTTKYSQLSRATKYILRGQLIESCAYFEKYIRAPLIGLLRLLHTPRHIDYGTVHISHHLPAADLRRLEALYRIGSIDDIRAALPAADALFDDVCARLRQKYGWA